MKPDLKILSHPDSERQWNMQVIDFGWGKVTVETGDSVLTNANTVYILELAKLEIMRTK